MITDYDGDWARLSFEEVALTEFRFLVLEYGFVQRAGDPSSVRYERDGIGVVVVHDRQSFEITVVVERSESRERFSVWEIARLQKAPEVADRTFVQATTTEEIERLLPILARLLKTYGSEALRGDPQVFLRLRQLQQLESDRFLREGRLRWVREQLPQIWQRHDYPAVVRLLEGLHHQDLTPSEVEKLAYARKQLDASH